MTGMTRNQNLVRRAPRQTALSIGQVAILESRVDAYLVVAVLKRQHLVMGKAKSPVFLVVRRSVRYPVRMLWNREQMRPEIAQRHGRVHGGAVIHDVQVALLKVHKPLSAGISDI